LGGRCNNYYESSPVGETVHHIITHNCNNDYESSPGGGDGSSNHHTQLDYYAIQYLGGEITSAIMITNLLLGRETVHQNYTHNCTFM